MWQVEEGKGVTVSKTPLGSLDPNYVRHENPSSEPGGTLPTLPGVRPPRSMLGKEAAVLNAQGGCRAERARGRAWGQELVQGQGPYNEAGSGGLRC